LYDSAPLPLSQAATRAAVAPRTTAKPSARAAR
jgi:hypothetical protein